MQKTRLSLLGRCLALLLDKGHDGGEMNWVSAFCSGSAVWILVSGTEGFFKLHWRVLLAGHLAEGVLELKIHPLPGTSLQVTNSDCQCPTVPMLVVSF